MAANIRRKMPKSDTLYVFDIFKPACVKFVDEFSCFGPVKIVDSPREAAEDAGTVISMVPGPREVEKVYLDASDGIVAASNASHRLLIECSTIDTPTARKVAKAIKDAGRGVYVDAPVSVSQSLSQSLSTCTSDMFREGFQQPKRGPCRS